MYKTKASAEKAQKAYYSKKNKDKGNQMQKTIIMEDLSKIEKATFKDVEDLLRRAIQEQFVFENGHVSWTVDFDQEYVYWDVNFYEYKNGTERYYDVTYKVEYMLDGVTVSLGHKPVKVEKETSYKEIKDKHPLFSESGDVNKSKDYEDMNWVEGIIEKVFKRFKKEEKDLVSIQKFVEEEMTAVEIMYSYPGETDGHGEGMSKETIMKMVESANKALDEGRLSSGLFHKENRDDIEILKIWVNEVDCEIGGTFVPEGSALVKTKFHNPELWQMRKSGELGGLSIGARGNKVENKDYTDE
jgi:hypothetical protein